MALAESFLADAPAHQPDEARCAGVEEAARDWLETQARVAGFWRDMVVDANGDLDLVRALEAHCEFLRAASVKGRN